MYLITRRVGDFCQQCRNIDQEPGANTSRCVEPICPTIWTQPHTKWMLWQTFFLLCATNHGWRPIYAKLAQKITDGIGGKLYVTHCCGVTCTSLNIKKTGKLHQIIVCHKIHMALTTPQYHAIDLCSNSAKYSSSARRKKDRRLSNHSDDFEVDYLIMVYLCLHPCDGDTPALASMGQTSA